MKKANGGADSNQPDSRSSLGLTSSDVMLGANKVLGPVTKSEKQTPNKVAVIADVAEAAASQSNGKLSEPEATIKFPTAA